MPLITRPQAYRVVREMLPRVRFTPAELLFWLEDTQRRNERGVAGRMRNAALANGNWHIPETRRCNIYGREPGPRYQRQNSPPASGRPHSGMPASQATALQPDADPGPPLGHELGPQ